MLTKDITMPASKVMTSDTSMAILDQIAHGEVDLGILPVSGHAGSAGPIPKPAALRPSDIFICQTDRPDWSRCGVRRQRQSPARAAMPSSCHRGHWPGSTPAPICGCPSGARSTRLPKRRPCFR